MLLKNFTQEQLNRTIERNLNRYNYDKKASSLIRGFGINNYFMSTDSNENYILKDINFDNKTSFLLIDDIGLQALIELYKLGIRNITLAASNKEILSFIRLSARCLFEDYINLNIYLVNELKDNYNIVICGNKKVLYTNYDYYIYLSDFNSCRKNCLLITKLNKIIDIEKLNLCKGSFYYKIVLGKDNHLFKSKEDFELKVSYNYDFKKIYELNKVKQKVSFNFYQYSNLTWNNLCLGIWTKFNAGGCKLSINPGFKNLDYIEPHNRGIKCIIFNNLIEKTNFLNFMYRCEFTGLGYLILCHSTGITELDFINVDWSHSWSYREILTEYGYSEEEIVYLFNKYDWNEIGDVK